MGDVKKPSCVGFFITVDLLEAGVIKRTYKYMPEAYMVGRRLELMVDVGDSYTEQSASSHRIDTYSVQVGVHWEWYTQSGTRIEKTVGTSGVYSNTMVKSAESGELCRMAYINNMMGRRNFGIYITTMDWNRNSHTPNRNPHMLIDKIKVQICNEDYAFYGQYLDNIGLTDLAEKITKDLA